MKVVIPLHIVILATYLLCLGLFHLLIGNSSTFDIPYQQQSKNQKILWDCFPWLFFRVHKTSNYIVWYNIPITNELIIPLKYPCNSTTKTTWWQMQMNWFTILRQSTVIIVESVLILIGLRYKRFCNPFSYTNKGEWWREWFTQLVYSAQVLQEPFIYIAV